MIILRVKRLIRAHLVLYFHKPTCSFLVIVNVYTHDFYNLCRMFYCYARNFAVFVSFCIYSYKRVVFTRNIAILFFYICIVFIRKNLQGGLFHDLVSCDSILVRTSSRQI